MTSLEEDLEAAVQIEAPHGLWEDVVSAMEAEEYGQASSLLADIDDVMDDPGHPAVVLDPSHHVGEIVVLAEPAPFVPYEPLRFETHVPAGPVDALTLAIVEDCAGDHEQEALVDRILDLSGVLCNPGFQQSKLWSNKRNLAIAAVVAARPEHAQPL